MRILLVTNNLVDQKLLSGLLTKYQHQVRVASHARQALSTYIPHENDVVLVDAMLSEMDAMEFVQKIRQSDVASQRMSIVVLTEDPVERNRCFQAGADHCLTRPFQIAEFHEWMRVARESGSSQHSQNEPINDAPINDAPINDAIDWQVALDAVGDRRDLLAELVDIFGTEYPTTLTAIQAAIDDRDPKRLQTSAHQLKGCLRYFGTTTASELARKLEDIGRSGQIDGAATMIEPLTNAVESLLPQLRKGPS